jgi:hypothetical protein
VTEEVLHRRSVAYEAMVSGPDEMRVVGTFRDERPWNRSRPPPGVLHEMTLEITVRPSDRTIVTDHVFPGIRRIRPLKPTTNGENLIVSRGRDPTRVSARARRAGRAPGRR